MEGPFGLSALPGVDLRAARAGTSLLVSLCSMVFCVWQEPLCLTSAEIDQWASQDGWHDEEQFRHLAARQRFNRESSVPRWL